MMEASGRSKNFDTRVSHEFVPIVSVTFWQNFLNLTWPLPDNYLINAQLIKYMWYVSYMTTLPQHNVVTFRIIVSGLRVAIESVPVRLRRNVLHTLVIVLMIWNSHYLFPYYLNLHFEWITTEQEGHIH